MATTAKIGTAAADAIDDAGSAECPNHWSTATPTASIAKKLSIAPQTRKPHALPCQSQTAATAVSGSQTARSMHRARWW